MTELADEVIAVGAQHDPEASAHRLGEDPCDLALAVGVEVQLGLVDDEEVVLAGLVAEVEDDAGEGLHDGRREVKGETSARRLVGGKGRLTVLGD